MRFQKIFHARITRVAMRLADRPLSRVARAGSRPAAPRRQGTKRLRERPARPARLRQTTGWRRLARWLPPPPTRARRRLSPGAFLAGLPIGGRRLSAPRAPYEYRSHAYAG